MFMWLCLLRKNNMLFKKTGFQSIYRIFKTMTKVSSGSAFPQAGHGVSTLKYVGTEQVHLPRRGGDMDNLLLKTEAFWIHTLGTLNPKRSLPRVQFKTVFVIIFIVCFIQCRRHNSSAVLSVPKSVVFLQIK